MSHQEETSVMSSCVTCELFYLCRIPTRRRMCFRTCQLHHTPCAASLKNCTQSRAAFIRCVRGQEKEEVVFWGSVVHCFWKETVLPEIICTFVHFICTYTLTPFPFITILVWNPPSHQRSSCPRLQNTTLPPESLPPQRALSDGEDRSSFLLGALPLLLVSPLFVGGGATLHKAQYGRDWALLVLLHNSLQTQLNLLTTLISISSSALLCILCHWCYSVLFYIVLLPVASAGYCSTHAHNVNQSSKCHAHYEDGMTCISQCCEALTSTAVYSIWHCVRVWITTTGSLAQ